MTEKLNDWLSDGDLESLNHIHLGADTTEDLGEATVRVLLNDGPAQEFDSVQILKIAGEPSVIAKEAVRAEGEPHLLPTRIWPYREVEAIVVPLDDGRLEAAGAERIGVNSEDGD